MCVFRRAAGLKDKAFFTCAFTIAAAVSLPVLAQTNDDLLSSGRVIELSFGGNVVLNTLQEQLETTNNIGAGPFPEGPTLTSTDILNMGEGPRLGLRYSQDLSNGLRAFVDISASQTTGDTNMVPVGGTFPGTHDDGLRLVGGNAVAINIEHRSFLFVAGVDVAHVGNTTFGVGLQGGFNEQSVSTSEPIAPRAISIDGENRYLGIMARAEHYTSLGDDTGLRVRGQMGLLSNRYQYDLFSDGGVDQTINSSGSGSAVSFGLSVQLEHQISDNTFLTGTVGVDGLYGGMNALDTYLDFRGTNTAAFIERDMISSAYISFGLARRF